MPNPVPSFAELEQHLLTGGIDAQCVRRMLDELRDHYRDSVDDLVASGVSEFEADRRARRRIGLNSCIAEAALQRDELLTWSVRHPLFAACGRSLVFVFALPLIPIVNCTRERGYVARWAVSISLAVLLTGSLLLTLNSIVS